MVDGINHPCVTHPGSSKLRHKAPSPHLRNGEIFMSAPPPCPPALLRHPLRTCQAHIHHTCWAQLEAQLSPSSIINTRLFCEKQTNPHTITPLPFETPCSRAVARKTQLAMQAAACRYGRCRLRRRLLQAPTRAVRPPAAEATRTIQFFSRTLWRFSAPDFVGGSGRRRQP